MRQNNRHKKKVFSKIEPLQISWASKTTVDRFWDYDDDLFLRLVFCISDVCVLRWELSSPKNLYLPESVKPSLKSLFYDKMDIYKLSLVSYVSLLSGAPFEENNLKNLKTGFDDSFSIAKVALNILYGMDKAKVMPRIDIDYLDQIDTPEENEFNEADSESENDERNENGVEERESKRVLREQACEEFDDEENVLIENEKEALTPEKLDADCMNIHEDVCDEGDNHEEFEEDSSSSEESASEDEESEVDETPIEPEVVEANVTGQQGTCEAPVANEPQIYSTQVAVEEASFLETAEKPQNDRELVIESEMDDEVAALNMQLAENEVVPIEDFTLPLIQDHENLSSSQAYESLQQMHSDLTEDYVPTLQAMLVAGMKTTLNLKEAEKFCLNNEVGDVKESEVGELIREQNEALSHRIMELEDSFEPFSVEQTSADESNHAPVLFSNQRTCINLMEADSNLVDTGIEAEQKQTPHAVLQVENSTIDELASLQPEDGPEIVFTDDGRVCMGENSSFSVMYAHRTYQPSAVETEPVRELQQQNSMLPGICSQDGDHANSEKNAKSKATVLKIQFQQSLKLYSDVKTDRKEFPMNSSMSLDQNECVPCNETGIVLDSPNRSFCFTSTPAQSAGSASGKSKIPRLPQLRTTSLSKSGDKSYGYPPRSATNKPSITPRSANTIARAPPTPLPKVSVSRESKIPRPAIPSGGNSSRSVMGIPSASSRASDRSTPSMLTTYSSSLHHKPPAAPTSKILRTSFKKSSPSPRTPITSQKISVPSVKPSVVPTAKLPKAVAKPAASTTVLTDAVIVSCTDRIRVKLRGSKDAQEELSRLFNEVLNSSSNLRDSSLSPMQLAKVLSKFDPSVSEFSLRDKQKLASKLITGKDQKIDFKTFIALYSK